MTLLLSSGSEVWVVDVMAHYLAGVRLRRHYFRRHAIVIGHFHCRRHDIHGVFPCYSYSSH